MNYKELISYDDKVNLYSNSNIPAENKVQDTDMNNIKNVVNGVINGTNVMGNIVVDSIRSKNIFNTALVNGKNNIIVSGNIIYSSGLAGTAWTYANSNYYINLKAGTYKLSVFIDTAETSRYSGIKVLDNNNVVIASKENIGGTDVVLTFTLNNDTNLGVMFKLDTGRIKVQLEEGDTATPYSPYQNLDGYDNYSTAEQKIGTWIDGKPLYRSVFNISNITGTNNNLVNVSSLNIDNLVHLYGFIKESNNNTFPIPLTDSSSNYNVLFFNGTYLRGRALIGSGGTITRAYAIIEYTKTTEVPSLLMATPLSDEENE